MELILELCNKSGKSINRSFLAEVVKRTLLTSGCKPLARKKITLSVAVVCGKEIKKLNRVYRKINKTTDVLSFAEYKNQAQLKKEIKKEIFLGEVVICFKEIERYAKSRKIPEKEELARMMSHATLHLLGFKHGRQMFALQEKAAAAVRKAAPGC